MDPGVEQRGEPLDQHRAHAGAAAGQGRETGEQGAAHALSLQGRPGAAGAAEHHRAAVAGALLGRDLLDHLAAEPAGQAVDRPVVALMALHHGAGRGNLGQHRAVERDRAVLPGDGVEIPQAGRAGAEDEVHGSHGSSVLVCPGGLPLLSERPRGDRASRATFRDR